MKSLKYLNISLFRERRTIISLSLVLFPTGKIKSSVTENSLTVRWRFNNVNFAYAEAAIGDVV